MDDAREIAKGLNHGLRVFLCQFAADLECFPEDDFGRQGQEAERLGLGSTSAWKGGWQFRLNDLGLSVRQVLQEEK